MLFMILRLASKITLAQKRTMYVSTFGACINKRRPGYFLNRLLQTFYEITLNLLHMAFWARAAAFGCCLLAANAAQRRTQTEPYLAKDCVQSADGSENLYSSGAFNVTNIYQNETIVMEDYLGKVDY